MSQPPLYPGPDPDELPPEADVHPAIAAAAIEVACELAADLTADLAACSEERDDLTDIADTARHIARHRKEPPSP